MTVAKNIWLEHWMPQDEWNLCVSLSGEEDDINAYVIHPVDAQHLLSRGVDNAGDVWDPFSQGRKRPRP